MEPLGNVGLDQINLTEGPAFEYDEQGLVTAYHQSHDQSSTLTIKVLSIIGGIIATLSFLVFLGLSGVYESTTGLIILGIVFITVSVVLNVNYDRLILDTFSVTTLISGYAMLAFSLVTVEVDFSLACGLIILIGLVALYLTQNFLYSFINVLVICSSLFAILLDLQTPVLIYIYLSLTAMALVYIFFNEANIITMRNRLSSLYDAVRIGLIFSFVALLSWTQNPEMLDINPSMFWVTSIVNSLLLFYLIYHILDLLVVQTIVSRILIYGLTLLILVGIVFIPTISGSLLILLLCYMVQYRLGLVIGIISLIVAVSKFYYDLNITLLNKSILLFFTGIAFLVLFLLTSKILKTDE